MDTFKVIIPNIFTGIIEEQFIYDAIYSAIYNDKDMLKELFDRIYITPMMNLYCYNKAIEVHHVVMKYIRVYLEKGCFIIEIQRFGVDLIINMVV